MSLPVHKPQNLKEVGLVVPVDHDEPRRSVSHATLVLELDVVTVFPFHDLSQKLDHLPVNDGGLSILRHQPVQWRERLLLHDMFTSGSQTT